MTLCFSTRRTMSSESLAVERKYYSHPPRWEYRQWFAKRGKHIYTSTRYAAREWA